MMSSFDGKRPKVHKTAYVAESSEIIGDVTVGKDCSIWPGVVLRGDEDSITIGDNTSVQDNTVIHTPLNRLPVNVGKNVTIGHNAIIHGCKIGDNCIVGMGAILLNGSEIGDWCIVGAGAVVTEGIKVPSGSLVVGVPAKIVKKLDKEHREKITKNWKEYVMLKDYYKKQNS